MAGNLAARIGPGRTVLILEAATTSTRCAARHRPRCAVAGEPPSPVGAVTSPQSAWTMLDLAAAEQARFWPVK